MIRLEDKTVRLRALEPDDVDILYAWENDPRVWEVSDTLAPYSKETLRKFIADQQYDIFRTRQLRLVVSRTDDGAPVGLMDIFDFDPLNRRAAVGILIYADADRRRGYASEALDLAAAYASEALGLHQLYCSVGVDNDASVKLFESRGFERTGVRRDWLRRNDGWLDEILFQKILI